MFKGDDSLYPFLVYLKEAHVGDSLALWPLSKRSVRTSGDHQRAVKAKKEDETQQPAIYIDDDNVWFVSAGMSW